MRIRWSLPWVGALVAVVVGVVLVVALAGGGSDDEGAAGTAAEKGDIVIGRVTAKTQFFSYLELHTAVRAAAPAAATNGARGGA